jgi:tetratricopeptide (TPR) repeat protein
VEDLLVMKKTFGFLAVCATVATLSLPVSANTTRSAAIETLQEPCGTDAKIALYAEVTAELQKDQAKAYEAAKKYVACPSDGADEAEGKRVTYLKNFIAKFEKARRKDQLTILIAKKDYPGAFEVGKQALADDPAYLKGYMELALAGALSGNQALAPDTITYAQKAIELIEGGAAPAKWDPFESKDDALAKLNYAIGSLQAVSNPDKAIPSLIKAAGYNSKIKTTPLTYAQLAEAYERGPYAKQSAEYKTVYGGKDETPESKLALENINQIIDREIDAYARAVALAGTDANKAAWLTALTDLYKFRNKSETGLPEMIAAVLQKPLPPVPTPLTTLPASATPAATPAAGSGNGSGASGTAAPAGAGTTQPKPPTTPATTKATTPTKPPKTRRAHVRGN